MSSENWVHSILLLEYSFVLSMNHLVYKVPSKFIIIMEFEVPDLFLDFLFLTISSN